MTTDTNFPLTAEDGHDDLPRTLRRAREEKEQAQRAAEAATTPKSPTSSSTSSLNPSLGAETDSFHAGDRFQDVDNGSYVESTVRRFDVPFLHLVSFFLKAALASIPAVIVLMVLLWGIGQAVEAFAPDLLQTKILIYNPKLFPPPQ